MTDTVKVLSDDEVAEIATRPWAYPYLHNTEQRVLLRVAERDALCATVRTLRVENKKLKDRLAEQRTQNRHLWEANKEIVSTNTALREQLAQAQRELETTKLGISPAWTCAICGQFCANTDELMKHECGMPYRVVRYGDGYEASMWVRSGAGGHFWTPLLATGYWAEPESFSTGIVKGLHLFDTHEEAQRAIERARLLNTNERILSIANPTSDPAT